MSVLRTRLIRRRAALRRRWVVGAADEVVQADVEEVGESFQLTDIGLALVRFVVVNGSPVHP